MNYKVDFSIPGLKMHELDGIYNKLLKCLDEKARKNLEVCVTDPIGGRHYIQSNIGYKPNEEKDFCVGCINLTCEGCKNNG